MVNGNSEQKKSKSIGHFKGENISEKFKVKVHSYTQAHIFEKYFRHTIVAYGKKFKCKHTMPNQALFRHFYTTHTKLMQFDMKLKKKDGYPWPPMFINKL